MAASNIAAPEIPTIEACPAPEKVSDQIERWLASDGDKTLGDLIDMFQEKSFALIRFLIPVHFSFLLTKPSVYRRSAMDDRSTPESIRGSLPVRLPRGE